MYSQILCLNCCLEQTADVWHLHWIVPFGPHVEPVAFVELKQKYLGIDQPCEISHTWTPAI